MTGQLNIRGVIVGTMKFMMCSNLEQLNDCIRNTTAACNPRQNSVRDKFSPRQNPRISFFYQKNNFVKKNSQIFSWTEFSLGFPVCFF